MNGFVLFDEIKNYLVITYRLTFTLFANENIIYQDNKYLWKIQISNLRKKSKLGVPLDLAFNMRWDMSSGKVGHFLPLKIC